MPKSKIFKSILELSEIDGLSLGTSWLHRLHSGAKIGVTLAFLACAASFPNEPRRLAALFIFPAVNMFLGKLPPAAILSRLLAVLPFAGAVAAGSLVSVGEGGGALCASLMLKSAVTASAALVLAASTPYPLLIARLGSWGAPNEVCAVFLLTYRYLWVLADEAAAMFHSYILRAASGEGRAFGLLNPFRRPKTPSGGVRARHMGIFLGQLLLRSFDRAERVYDAMLSRGFDGSLPVNGRENWKFMDSCYTVISLGGLACLRFWTYA
ncbi:MAG: hypothetical protein LBU36_07795 [Clostridiales bacterium]|jgi:cobalt/nickel transport system permease protein|nr:hypothetical protein [Clostridiales bacterium]